MSQVFEIFTDGACSGNPGPAGIGFVILESGEVVQTGSEYIGEATNNMAEYTALIRALQAAKELNAERLAVRTDSELMFKQVRGEYKVKNEKIQPLYTELMGLLKSFKGVEFKHVPREQNAEADRLATSAIKNKKQEASPSGCPDVFHIGEESPSSEG